MSQESQIVSKGPRPRMVRSSSGEVLEVPAEWELLPPGDAGLTRRVKAAGPSWAVQEKKGRKTFSHGIWASAEIISNVRAELELERADPAFAKRREAETRRRERHQNEYVEDFHQATLNYLAFAACYQELAERLAKAVVELATPVGSGTVARTKRIPIEERAEAAVIAWMQHQTTGYDGMVIPRVKGKRREIRRMRARRSQELLGRYRRGEPAPEGCPLMKVLMGTTSTPSQLPAGTHQGEHRAAARQRV